MKKLVGYGTQDVICIHVKKFLRILMIHFKTGRWLSLVGGCSMLVSTLAVMVLALTGETYAVIVVFALLMLKIALLLKVNSADSRSMI